MRRSDREITDFNEMIGVMEQCDVCRLALNDGDFPYIVPLNFGMEVTGGTVALYFHSALEGTKLDLIRRDNRASFEMDCGHRLVTDEENGTCTMEYRSVIGKGYIEMLGEDEKYRALCILMKHYHKEDFEFNRDFIPRTAVYRLTVESFTGKARTSASSVDS